MADVKWIKIVTDVFDDEKIQLIDGLPERDGIIVIWFKLLCLAGKQNNGGVFMLNDKIAYTDEMLATIFRRPVNTVRLALKTFEQFGMIEIVNNTIIIPNWEKHQSLDKLETAKEKNRLRVAKHREKQRLIASEGVTVCQYCGRQATGFDHIIAISNGGTDTEENKIPCCIECNRIKNNRPIVEFLNNNRNLINDDIVTSNKKLAKFVTLCNVTHRYIVTPCNAIDKDIEEDKEKNNIYIAVIEHLNNKAGTNYKASAQATQRHINARIAEGFTVDDFKTVIDKKCAEWNGSEMAKYLRPETLFGTKFESYLNAPATRDKADKSNNNDVDLSCFNVG